VAVQVEATTDGSGVIQDMLKFVELLQQTTRELTPTEQRVCDFLTQLDVNCYDIASRRIDAEVAYMRSVYRLTCLLQLDHHHRRRRRRRRRGVKRSAVASRRCDLSPKRFVIRQFQSICHRHSRVPT